MQDERQLAKKIISLKDKYFCFASRPASIQRICPLARTVLHHFGSNAINFQEQGDDIGYYLEKSKYRKMSLDLLKRFQSRHFIAKHLADYRIFGRIFLGIGRRAKQVAPHKKDLLRLFLDYEQAFNDISFFFFSTFSVDDYVFPALARELKKKIPAARYAAALETISSPTIVFGYQKYQIALLKAKTSADYDNLVQKYRWIKEYSFQEKLLDKKMALSDRRQLVKANLAEEILKTPLYCRRQQAKLATLLKSIKDPNLRARIKLVNSYINIKTERIEIYKMLQADFRDFFRKLLGLIKEDLPHARYEDMISLTNREIIAYLDTGRLPDLKETKRRFAKQYVLFNFRGRNLFIYDLSLVNDIRQAYLSVSATELIRGQAVSPGFARGRVKLIRKRSDLSGIKTGQILVSNFTTPDYVPAMKKAAAIITDDGGITCHAAIIARELKKPCIVGTKIATRILHDNDHVEVDAGQGTVKILR